MDLREHLKNISGSYDKNYQDIECIGFKGYSQSHLTWANMKDAVDWKDKVICDLGCFHAYFSIKAINAGADYAICLDRSTTVLETADNILAVSGIADSRARIEQWDGGDPIPKCDIILCLNCLHHFDDIDKALSEMHTTTIFEINNSDLESVLKYFNILSTLPSHRENRNIYVCERK